MIKNISLCFSAQTDNLKHIFLKDWNQKFIWFDHYQIFCGFWTGVTIDYSLVKIYVLYFEGKVFLFPRFIRLPDSALLAVEDDVCGVVGGEDLLDVDFWWGFELDHLWH